MSEQNQWTRELAMEYIEAYARYEHVRLDECIKINTTEKIRGDVGAADLEYSENEKMLIARGLVDLYIWDGNPEFKKMILGRIFQINNSVGDKFDGAILEHDISAFELDSEIPERLNIRLNFNTPVGKTEFVRRVDQLMDKAFKFKKTEYSSLLHETSEQLFGK